MNTEDFRDESYEQEEPKEWRFTIWHAIGLMVLLGILQAWIYFVIHKTGQVDLKNLSWVHVALITGVSGFLTAWAGATLSGYSLSRAVMSGTIEQQEAVSATIAILGVCILSSELNNLLRRIAPLPAEMDLAGVFNTGNLAGILFTVSVVAPVIEELIFRGVILDGLRQNYRLQTAIVVSSSLFALVHVHPYLIVNAFFLGLLFAYIRLRSGSLLLCILIHGTYNAIPFVLTRVFSVEIQGFTPAPDGMVEFQPFWFDALGLVLTGLGLAGLTKTTKSAIEQS